LSSSEYGLRTKRDLQRLAERLGPQIREYKKPFVIEFSGTPKSGKTTCVDAIAKFFRRNGFSVSLVTERASICPVRDKEDISFNVWTGATSLTKLIEALEHEASIVILDRGIFDSLVWMEFHKETQGISEGEFDIIKRFFLLEKFRTIIDMVVVLSVAPEKALEREFKDQITDITGTIMNPATLAAYNRCIDHCIYVYRAEFRRMIVMDTTASTPLEGVSRIARALLSTAEGLLDEEIAVVPREVVQSLMADESSLTDEKRLLSMQEGILDNLSWVRRSVAEEDPFRVQMIPVAAIRRGDSDLLISTSVGGEHGSMANKNACWLGGHTRRDDLPRNAHTKTVFRRTLRRELREELRLSLELTDISRVPVAAIWDNTSSRSAMHLALFYEYTLPMRRVPRELDRRVVTEHEGKSLFLRFMGIDEALLELENLEVWSILYLSSVHGLPLPPAMSSKQVKMF